MIIHTMKIHTAIFALMALPFFLFADGIHRESPGRVAPIGTDTASARADSALVNRLYPLGLKQRADGMAYEAQQTFQRIVDMQPSHYAAQHELARVSLELQDFRTAQQAAEAAAQGRPGEKAYWELLLEVYKRTGNLPAMPAVFEALSSIEPDNPSHYYSEAYVHFLSKDYERALALYARARERVGDTEDGIMGEAEVHMAMDNPDAAIRGLETFLKQKPETVRPHMLLAELHTLTDKPRRALATLDVAAGRFPDEGIVALGRADAYLAMGRQRQAVDNLRQAFAGNQLDIDAKASVLYTTLSNETRPLGDAAIAELADMLASQYAQDPRAHAVRGDVYAQLGDLDKARAGYLKALEINMYLEPVWQQLLQTELQLGMNDEVEKHGAEAAALFPNNHLISFFTGHGLLGNKKHAEARKLFENALNNADEENPALMTQLYSSLGDVYNALDMHAESDVAYEEAIATDTANAYALNNYAYYLALRKEKLDQAEAMAGQAVRLAPDVEHYEDTYAWVLFQMGRYDEALVWIQRAIKSADEPSEVLYEHYGDILAMNGEIDKAVAQWKRARTVATAVGKDIDALSKKINERQYIE